MAVATGASSGGIGSDGGGSIRVPAHFSGICGFKPTPGRMPATGHQPACLGPFSLIGVVRPMARTVGDLRLLDRVLSGYDVDDPMSVPLEEQRHKAEGKRQKNRVAFFENYEVVPVTAETRAAVRRAARAAAGLTVEEYCPPALADAARVWEVFFAEMALLALHEEVGGAERDLPILRSYLERKPICASAPSRAASVPSVASVAEASLSSAQLVDAWVMRDRLRAEFQAQLGPHRVLLCPAAAMPAFGHRERSWSVEGTTVGYLEAMRYTQWFNILGAPAIVVPVGQSSDGLPIGVQVAGRPFDDELVLHVAGLTERECGGYRPPPGFDDV